MCGIAFWQRIGLHLWLIPGPRQGRYWHSCNPLIGLDGRGMPRQLLAYNSLPFLLPHLAQLFCKTVSQITYTVLVETLNPAQSVNQSINPALLDRDRTVGCCPYLLILPSLVGQVEPIESGDGMWKNFDAGPGPNLYGRYIQRVYPIRYRVNPLNSRSGHGGLLC